MTRHYRIRGDHQTIKTLCESYGTQNCFRMGWPTAVSVFDSELSFTLNVEDKPDDSWSVAFERWCDEWKVTLMIPMGDN